MNKLSILLTFEFADGQIGYVQWELELFRFMWHKKYDEMVKTFFDENVNGYG